MIPTRARLVLSSYIETTLSHQAALLSALASRLVIGESGRRCPYHDEDAHTLVGWAVGPIRGQDVRIMMFGRRTLDKCRLSCVPYQSPRKVRLVARGVRLRLFIFGERGLCSVPTLSASSMLATYDAYEVRYVLGGRYEVWKVVFATDETSHESAQPSGL